MWFDRLLRQKKPAPLDASAAKPPPAQGTGGEMLGRVRQEIDLLEAELRARGEDLKRQRDELEHRAEQAESEEQKLEYARQTLVETALRLRAQQKRLREQATRLAARERALRDAEVQLEMRQATDANEKQGGSPTLPQDLGYGSGVAGGVADAASVETAITAEEGADDESRQGVAEPDGVSVSAESSLESPSGGRPAVEPKTGLATSSPARPGLGRASTPGRHAARTIKHPGRWATATASSLVAAVIVGLLTWEAMPPTYPVRAAFVFTEKIGEPEAVVAAHEANLKSDELIERLATAAGMPLGELWTKHNLSLHADPANATVELTCVSTDAETAAELLDGLGQAYLNDEWWAEPTTESAGPWGDDVADLVASLLTLKREIGSASRPAPASHPHASVLDRLDAINREQVAAAESWRRADQRVKEVTEQLAALARAQTTPIRLSAEQESAAIRQDRELDQARRELASRRAELAGLLQRAIAASTPGFEPLAERLEQLRSAIAGAKQSGADEGLSATLVTVSDSVDRLESLLRQLEGELSAYGPASRPADTQPAPRRLAGAEDDVGSPPTTALASKPPAARASAVDGQRSATPPTAAASVPDPLVAQQAAEAAISAYVESAEKVLTTVSGRIEAITQSGDQPTRRLVLRNALRRDLGQVREAHEALRRAAAKATLSGNARLQVTAGAVAARQHHVAERTELVVRLARDQTRGRADADRRKRRRDLESTLADALARRDAAAASLAKLAERPERTMAVKPDLRPAEPAPRLADDEGLWARIIGVARGWERRRVMAGLIGLRYVPAWKSPVAANAVGRAVGAQAAGGTTFVVLMLVWAFAMSRTGSAVPSSAARPLIGQETVTRPGLSNSPATRSAKEAGSTSPSSGSPMKSA